jgi:phosphatidylglycerophosphate synthase
MFDPILRRMVAPVLDRSAARLATAGISANLVSIAGFVLGAAGAACVGAEQYGAGLALFLVNRACDGLDGAIARRRGATDRGGFLDICLDFILYAGFVFGFAVARPAENALAAAFLLFSFMGTASTFLAFAAIAARRGLTTDRYGPKAIHYLGGLTEGGETILAFVLFCALPDHFAPLAAVFGSLCCTTALSRLYAGWHAFGGPPVESVTRRAPD